MRRTVGFKIPICEMRRDNGATVSVWLACLDETQQIDDKWKTRSLSGSESVETMTEQLETQHWGKTHAQIQDRQGRAGRQAGGRAGGQEDGRMDGQTNTRAVGPVDYSLSRSCSLGRLLSFFLSFHASFVPSSLGVSSEAPTQHPGWGVCERARVCVQEHAWQVHVQYGAPHGKTGWERSPCLRHPEVKADA